MTKRNRNKNKRKQNHEGPSYSKIEQHVRQGKKLLAPINTIQKLDTSSAWRDDHAPEMLWAFLVAVAMPRDDYLGCFRAIINWYSSLPPEDQKPAAASGRESVGQANFNLACEIDHASLMDLSDHHFEQFIRMPLAHPLGYGALRPLLLLDSLPGIERWRTKLAVQPTKHDWKTLAEAIAASLDHQSEKSTDVRWLKCVLKIVLGKFVVPEEMAEKVEEILAFPNMGDLRKVRPSIRAWEMMIRRKPPSAWIEKFWEELLRKTECIDGSREAGYFKIAEPILSGDTILAARRQALEGFRTAISTTAIDAKLDSAFGFTLYALSLLEEIAISWYSQSLLGRAGLRTLAEIVITFAYLVKQDSATLWTTYRSFGSGQAKLAFLKIQYDTGEAPAFVEQETLFQIANEDMWQEFVNIDLGHWVGKSLREIATAGGTKDIYDKYYDWTSAFVHGHWCSIRDSNFSTCHNPLHRLHRIPRPYHRLMPSVTPDAVKLVNQTFDLLEALFPAMDKLERIRSVTADG